VCRVFCVSDTAEVELKSARVQAPEHKWNTFNEVQARVANVAAGLVVARCSLTLSNLR